MSSKKEMTAKEVFHGIVGLVIIIGMAWIYFSSGGAENKFEQKGSAATEEPLTKAKVQSEPSAPKIADINIKISTDGMKLDYPDEIRDAAVTQKDWELSLVLIVGAGMNEMRAKELGDNFLRQVMSNSGGIEKVPGKEIGPTKFSYLVGIYGPGEQQIALGAKAPASRSITW